jgi:hypothetical protein
LPTAAYGKIVNSIGYKAMPGEKSLLSVVIIGFKWVVNDTAEAGIAGVQARRFLIEKSIGNTQQQPVRIAMVELCLECIGTSMPDVSVREQEIAEIREGQTS